MPGPWSRTASPARRRSTVALTSNRRCRRRVLRRVLEQVRQRRGGQARIEPHQPIDVDRDVDACAAQRLLDLARAPPRRSPTARTQRVLGDRRRLDARHLEDVLEQAGQPIDLGEDQLALLAPLVARRATTPAGCRRRRESPSAAFADRGRATPAAPTSAPRSGARDPRPCARRGIARARWRSRPAPASASSVRDRRPAGRCRQQADRPRAEPQRHQAHLPAAGADAVPLVVRASSADSSRRGSASDAAAPASKTCHSLPCGTQIAT